MKKYFIFTMILLSSCSKYKGDRNSLNYNSVEIEFDGYGEYDIERSLIIPITDSTVVNQLNDLKNTSKSKYFASIKGTEYVIILIYTDSSTGDQLLIKILKSVDSTPTIIYGRGLIFEGTYKNIELVNYIASIIKLKAIKKYKGSLSQEEYEKL